MSCQGDSGHAPPASPNIVLISVDTLRPDHLGIYGYRRNTSPSIDRWFSDAVVFTRAYTTEANTSPAVMSLLTGQLPQEHGVRLLFQRVPDSTKILPTLLPASYQSAAIVSNIVLTDEAMGIARRFDHYDDYVHQKEPYRDVYERNAEKTTDAALAWASKTRDVKRPFFLWVHYIDPHGPYHPPDDWTFSFSHDDPVPINVERVPDYQREPGISDGRTYVDRYDEEIAYLDRAVGRLLKGLFREAGRSNTYFVFTADHGESMMEHEHWFTHGYHVYEEIIRIPLLIRGPRLDGRIVKEPVSLIDFVPTVLRLVGVKPPLLLGGKDLLDNEHLGNRTVFAEATQTEFQWRAAIRGDEKSMVKVERGTGLMRQKRRYRLDEDPGEGRPRSWNETPPRTALRLFEMIRSDPDPGGYPASFEEGIRLTAPKVSPRVGPEVLEKLKSLGYVQ